MLVSRGISETASLFFFFFGTLPGTSPSSFMVIFSLTPSGQTTCNWSLFNCSKNTIRTNNVLNIKNAYTLLFRSSIRSPAIRACWSLIRKKRKKRNKISISNDMKKITLRPVNRWSIGSFRGEESSVISFLSSRLSLYHLKSFWIQAM